MDKPNIVVTFQAPQEMKDLLQQLLGSDGALIFLDEVPPAQRKETLEHADVLFAWNFPREITPQEYPYLQHVRFIQLVSAGADHMPYAELPAQISIASNPGAYAIPMAEHVMALTLALAKRICIENEKLKHGEFDQFTPNRLLDGSTAGILGFGGIGQATAHLMRAFHMPIYAINTSGTTSQQVEFIGTLHDLKHVLQASDVVVISLPLTKETRGLIGKEQLDWMKRDAILINVARAAIIDEEALYNHAKSHPNFLVGIDAWWTEPFSKGQFRMEYPFLDLPNVLGSPHNSGLVPGTMPQAVQMAAENIQHFLEGEKVRGVIQREAYV
jgi:phosphoglycerate dehydrogenase-like enzyme